MASPSPVPPPPPLALAGLEALYDAHHRQAIGLAYRILGDLGDAEEVVQEVFLSAWRSGHTYDPARGSTHTWILSMVRNRSIDVLRGRRTSILFSGIDVRAWRVVSTEGIALGSLRGTALEPFVIRWDRLPPPNTSWVSHFVLDYADGTSHELLVHVTVRAPGLVE